MACSLSPLAISVAVAVAVAASQPVTFGFKFLDPKTESSQKQKQKQKKEVKGKPRRTSVRFHWSCVRRVLIPVMALATGPPLHAVRGAVQSPHQAVGPPTLAPRTLIHRTGRRPHPCSTPRPLGPCRIAQRNAESVRSEAEEFVRSLEQQGAAQQDGEEAASSAPQMQEEMALIQAEV